MIHSLKTTAIIATMALLWIEAFSQDMKTSSDINRYANSVLGLNDTYAASLANYRKLLSDADGKFTAIRYGGVIQSMPIDCSCLQISQNKSDDLHTKMSNVSDFMWKNELNGLIQAAESASQRAVIQCSYLNNYFVNSEYYNDRSNQLFDRLKADFVAAIRDASSSWNTAVQASVRASRGDYSLVANSYGSSQQAYGGNYSNSNYSTGSGYASSGGYGSNSSDYANLRSSSSYANTYGGAPYTYPYGNYTKGRSDNSSSSRSSYSSRAQRNANQGTYYSSANRSYGNYGSSSYGSPSYGSNYSGSSYGNSYSSPSYGSSYSGSSYGSSYNSPSYSSNNRSASNYSYASTGTNRSNTYSSGSNASAYNRGAGYAGNARYGSYFNTQPNTSNCSDCETTDPEGKYAFLSSMRDDIVALKNLLDGLDVGYSIDYQSTNRYANDISTSLSANRQKYGNSLSKWGYGASQQSTYQDFYKNCSSSLSYINELVKIGNSTSNKSANTINQARQAYDNAVVLFNSFVQ